MPAVVCLCVEFVDMAQTRLKNFSNTRVVVADAQNLPFDNGSFSRYFSNLTLMEVADPDNMLTEAARGPCVCLSCLQRELCVASERFVCVYTLFAVPILIQAPSLIA